MADKTARTLFYSVRRDKVTGQDKHTAPPVLDGQPSFRPIDAQDECVKIRIARKTAVVKANRIEPPHVAQLSVRQTVYLLQEHILHPLLIKGQFRDERFARPERVLVCQLHTRHNEINPLLVHS